MVRPTGPGRDTLDVMGPGNSHCDRGFSPRLFLLLVRRTQDTSYVVRERTSCVTDRHALTRDALRTLTYDVPRTLTHDP